jgi:hypothetical protein
MIALFLSTPAPAHRAEEEPAANCHTETYLWVTQERGEPLYVPLVALVTSRRVEAGEEVTWSYGDPYWTAARRNMETYVKAYEEREAAQVGGGGCERLDCVWEEACWMVRLGRRVRTPRGGVERWAVGFV